MSVLRRADQYCEEEEKKMDDAPTPMNASNASSATAQELQTDLRSLRHFMQQEPQIVQELLQQPLPKVSDNQNDSCIENDKPICNTDRNSMTTAAPSHQQQQQPSFFSRRSLTRSLLVDLPLVLLFALYLAVYSLQILHDDYYVQLFDRARRTDKDLLEEFTYYERQCNRYDLSTSNLQDMAVLSASNTNQTLTTDTIVTDAVDKMMTHGAVVIPQILNATMVAALRQHVVDRNAAVSQQEAFPVSQGIEGLRVSYGIDATEATAVTNAIIEIANHPILKPLLQQLTGDQDPASAEITAITSYAGADDQVWHADTKGDGNALKFARTYTHSYSLFVPLQDTTEAMGATDICPGTQYCANGLEELCQETKMGLHMVDPKRRVFPAGDGALLNQHVWHRGSAHTDPTAPERVVFIMSFLARPPTNASNKGGDARQLSRGTYFHQRWNMWGHTLLDLLNPNLSMGYPFSVLRALGVWKPATRNWGYDFTTSAFLRFSNEQLEEDELYDRFMKRLDELKFPEFLRGHVLRNTFQKKSWQIFIKGTLDKTFDFLKLVNGCVHGVYIVGLLAMPLVTRRASCITQSTKRLIITHGALIFITWRILRGVHQSQWGQDVLTGRQLRRPFPPVYVAQEDEPKGLTTFPTRLDVLVGTRFDAEFLGSYERWLDYHPGNVLLRQTAKHFANGYNHAEPVFAQGIETIVLDQITGRDGRFLLQDYRTGDWRIMSETDASAIVREYLLVEGNIVLADMRTQIDRMVADYRFGALRDTQLARISQEHLLMLRRSILRHVQPSSNKSNEIVASRQFPFTRRTMLHHLVSPSVARDKDSIRNSNSTTAMKTSAYHVGSLVWVKVGGSNWFLGSVVRVRSNGLYDVSFDDGEHEANVQKLRLQPYKPVTEGNRVEGCFDPGLESCFAGTVGRVHPSGRVMIAFDDGDVEWNMPPDRYYIPPFKYEMEYYY